MITEEEFTWFRARYRGVNPDQALQYALNAAREYADKHAKHMAPSIQDNVVRLHLLYALQGDPGEKQLIRIAIDACLDMGRAINAAARR